MSEPSSRKEQRRRRTARAALLVAVLAGSLALPFLALALAEEPAPFCCRGRCCCTGEATPGGDSRPCLRVRCGCGRTDAAVIAAPLRLEALLPAVATPARTESRRIDQGPAPAVPIDRPHAPPLPPPKRRLPA
jgi:hypothetical protein